LEAVTARTHALAASMVLPERDSLSTLLSLDVRWQLAESLLQKADKMSMGASIELRSPILDIEVGKVAARIPSSFKLSPKGLGKYVLRKALSRKLNEPMNRPKKGFPIPLHEWFTGPLREQIEGELLATNSCVARHLDSKLLRAAWEDVIAGSWDGSRGFCALWFYERWCRAIVS